MREHHETTHILFRQSAWLLWGSVAVLVVVTVVGFVGLVASPGLFGVVWAAVVAALWWNLARTAKQIETHAGTLTIQSVFRATSVPVDRITRVEVTGVGRQNIRLTSSGASSGWVVTVGPQAEAVAAEIASISHM